MVCVPVLVSVSSVTVPTVPVFAFVDVPVCCVVCVPVLVSVSSVSVSTVPVFAFVVVPVAVTTCESLSTPIELLKPNILLSVLLVKLGVSSSSVS